MPIYEYVCRACGHDFELLVREPQTPPACPSCSSPELERIVSGFAVSSDGIRQRNVRAAKKQAAADRTRQEKRLADQAFTREHFTEDGIILPPADKPK